jgi:hypothetical protein
MGDLVMFLLCSVPTLYDAAKKLHKAMWRQDLGRRLQDVDQCEGLKYLPATVINDLQLLQLGCNATAILVREEYSFTLRALEGCHTNSGGIVLMGHPGIGMNLLRKDYFAHVLITSR